MISPEIKPNPDQPGTYGVPCALVKDIKAEVTLNFLTEDNKTLPLTIPSSELSVGPFRNNESLCQTFINGDIFTSIGGSLLKHYYSVWDVGNLRMGFAPAGEFSVHSSTSFVNMISHCQWVCKDPPLIPILYFWEGFMVICMDTEHLIYDFSPIYKISRICF